MKRTTKQYLVAVIGLVVIIFGLLLVSSVVYAQTQSLNLSATDQNISLNPNEFASYTFTVNAENPTTFVWQLDGVTVQADNPYDEAIATGQTSYTLVTGSLSNGPHSLVCSQSDLGDSITFNIYIVRPGVLTPTPSPTPHPYSTPTPHPFATPTATPFTIIPISNDPTQKILITVFGFLLIGVGSLVVWLRKLF